LSEIKVLTKRETLFREAMMRRDGETFSDRYNLYSHRIDTDFQKYSDGIADSFVGTNFDIM